MDYYPVGRRGMKGILIEDRDDVEKYVLRYAKTGETRCMMVLKDGTEFEVPIMRPEGGKK